MSSTASNMSDDLPKHGQWVVADKTPNPLYHGHRGMVVDCMVSITGLRPGEYVAEVVWEKPPPVGALPRQVIKTEFLVSIPTPYPGDIIEEDDLDEILRP
jgi:hypothetical protein